MIATAVVPAPTAGALPAVAEFAGYTARRAAELAQRDLPRDITEALQDIERRARSVREAASATIGGKP